MLRQALSCGLLLLSMLCCAEHAGATPEPSPTPEARKRAGAHFDRGLALFRAGDYSGALAEFEAAHRAAPSWQVLINVGITHSRLRRYDRALQTLKRYLAEGGAKVPAEMRAKVEAELKRINELLAMVRVSCAQGEAQVHVDGRLIGKTPLQLQLGPGSHELRVSLAGYAPWEKTLEIVSGKNQELNVKLERLQGILRVQTLPAGALAAVGKDAPRKTPFELRLDPGKYPLVARLRGHHEARTAVLLDASKTRQVMLTLMAIPTPKEPWYTRWYWWAAIGAGVAAATVTTVVLLSDTEHITALTVPPRLTP